MISAKQRVSEKASNSASIESTSPLASDVEEMPLEGVVGQNFGQGGRRKAYIVVDIRLRTAAICVAPMWLPAEAFKKIMIDVGRSGPLTTGGRNDQDEG